MKLFFAYLITILLLKGTFGDSLVFDAFANIASGVAKGINDTAVVFSSADDENDTNNFSIPDLFGNAIKGAVDVANDFGQAATNVAGSAIQIGADTVKNGINAFTNVGKLIENGIQNSVKTFNNVVKTANRIGKSAVKNAVIASRIPVKMAQSALEKLNNVSQDRLRKAMNEVNKAVDAENRLKSWAEEQKSKFEFSSEETKNKAYQEIEEFIQAREEETQKCARDLLESTYALFNNSRIFTESVLPEIDNVMKNIQKCVSSSRTASESRQCATSIRRSFGSLLSIPRRADELKAQFIGNGIDSIINGPCIAETRINDENGKKETQNKLDNLLASELDLGDVTTLDESSNTSTSLDTEVNEDEDAELKKDY